MEAGNLIFLEFAEAMQPIFKEVRSKDWVMCGEQDNYPEYLLDLFNNSAKHNAIIKGKANYIFGKGFGFKDVDSERRQKRLKEEFLSNVNQYGESLDDIARKSITDLELHGGFYLEVIWNKAGNIAEIYHGSYHKYRSNKDNTSFYYREDGKWYAGRRDEVKEIPAFDVNSRKGKQIFYYKLYRPGIQTYTLPDYVGALNYIEADKEVGKHTLNNAKCGFTPSKLINLNDGKAEEEMQKKIEGRFKKKFTGSDGVKFILSFNKNKDTATTVEDLGSSDLTKEDFTAIDKLIEQNIFAGHQVTSPSLFGIKTEGQLGGRNELRDAFEIFQNTYVNGRQQIVEEVFDMLIDLRGAPVEIYLQPVEPIKFQFGESIMAGNMTQDEIRETFGKESIQLETSEEGQKLFDIVRNLPKPIADKLLTALPVEKLFEMVGVEGIAPAPEEDPEKPQFVKAHFSDKDADIFAEFGKPKSGYSIIRSKSVRFAEDALEDEELFYENFAETQIEIANLGAKILDLIKKDKRITPEVIAKTLGVSKKVVTDHISEYETKGYLKTKETKVGEDVVIERTLPKSVAEVVSDKKPSTTEVSIKYSYEGPKDEKNRPFCAKILELDRLYSRFEIEQISQRLGYSVWDRRGGWYTVPGTDTHRPYCRHRWQSNVVVKRSEG